METLEGFQAAAIIQVPQLNLSALPPLTHPHRFTHGTERKKDHVKKHGRIHRKLCSEIIALLKNSSFEEIIQQKNCVRDNIVYSFFEKSYNIKLLCTEIIALLKKS